MALEEVANPLVEEIPDVFVSLTNPEQILTLRTAHFVNPCFPFSNGPLPNLPRDAFTTTQKDPNSHPLILTFPGWLNPKAEWIDWVEKMEPIHKDTWRNAGILDAIRATKYNIHQDDSVIFGLARRWSRETNSFLFKWGEASVTLEDVCFLGGFSVLGEAVSDSVPPQTDMAKIEERLEKARTLMNKRPSKKATYTEWLNIFKYGSYGFRDIEHVAFLVYWLSKFVFPKVNDTVGRHVQAMAIQLARGTKIALAPTVLASLYAELGKLKESISRAPLNLGKSKEKIMVLWSPMHLLQVWAWERFLGLGLNPNLLEDGDPRMARWDDLNGAKVDDISGLLDAAGESFWWRPYYMAHVKWTWHELFLAQEDWNKSFAMFIRNCKLVGLHGLIETYLPHRFSRQFGLDQDVPGLVPNIGHTVESAWTHYKRPFAAEQLHVPHHLYEPDVTLRYSNWWKDEVEDKMTISEIFRSFKKAKDNKDGTENDQ